MGSALPAALLLFLLHLPFLRGPPGAILVLGLAAVVLLVCCFPQLSFPDVCVCVCV